MTLLVLLVATLSYIPAANLAWLATRNLWPHGPKPAPWNWRVYAGPHIYYQWLKRGAT